MFAALTWPVRPPQPAVGGNRFLDRNVKTQLRKDEQMLQGMDFNQIEQEFRKRVSAVGCLMISARNVVLSLT